MARPCPTRWDVATGFSRRGDDWSGCQVGRMRLRRTGLLLAAAACGTLSACNREAGGASSADSHAPGTTNAKVAASCSAYPTGAAGVIRTFCDGPAAATVTIAGKTHTLQGGTCQNQEGLFSLNIGVVSGPDLAGPKPDYFGLTTTTTAGPFTNATLAVTVDGKGYALTSNTGQTGPQGGSFSGVAMTGETVTGTFHC